MLGMVEGLVSSDLGELPVNRMWKTRVVCRLGGKPNHALDSLSVNGDKVEVEQNRAVLRGIRAGVNPRLRDHMGKGRAGRKVIEV